jgi:hypothetical protein
LTFTLAQPVHLTTGTAGFSLFDNNGQPLTLTGATATNNTVTVTFSETLSADAYVAAYYDYSSGNIRNEANASMFIPTSVVGSNSANIITLPAEGVMNDICQSLYWFYGNDGDDTITGAWREDIIVSGKGADTIITSSGDDFILLGEPTPAIDTVVADSYGLAHGMTIVDSFDVNNTGGVNNDRINLPSSTIATDTERVAGIASGTYAQHSISNGILTFYDSSNNPILYNGNTVTYYNDGVNYLINNITAPGATVAVETDTDDDGIADSLGIFQDGGFGGGEDLFLALGSVLVGADGLPRTVTLGTSAGENVVQLVDTTAPNIESVLFNGNSITFEYEENISFVTSPADNSFFVNGTSPLTLTNPVVLNNALTFTVSQTLANTDWLLINSAPVVQDASGNTMTIEPGGTKGAIGGSGDTVIDLSSFSDS